MPRVLAIELLTPGPSPSWFTAHVMIPNFSGVMTQTVAVWCEDLGCTVELRTYTGNEKPDALLAGDWDLVFVSAFTRGAYTAYAIAAALRARGVVTVLGGPHARAFPEDAALYFDYVLGLTDQDLIRRVVEERRVGVPGQRLEAASQPAGLPSLRRRARFIEATRAKARLLHVVAVQGSLGCPYSCNFCMDSTVPYQPLDAEQVAHDLRFARDTWPDALLFWMDPNFGVRFSECLEVVERAVPEGGLRFGAESSLGLLSRRNLGRLARAGCVAMLPGIESWFGYGNKAGSGVQGHAKMERVAEKINEVRGHIPYVQANFVLGLDADTGEEPFALTTEFLRRAPGIWPGFSLFTCFGTSTPLGQELAPTGRLLPVPYPLLDNNTCLNVRLQGYTLPEFYQHLIALCQSAFGADAMYRRARTKSPWMVRTVDAGRAIGHEGRGRLRWHRQTLGWLQTDKAFRDFFEGESTVLPVQLRQIALSRSGPFADLLPPEISAAVSAGQPTR